MSFVWCVVQTANNEVFAKYFEIGGVEINPETGLHDIKYIRRSCQINNSWGYLSTHMSIHPSYSHGRNVHTTTNNPTMLLSPNELGILLSSIDISNVIKIPYGLFGNETLWKSKIDILRGMI